MSNFWKTLKDHWQDGVNVVLGVWLIISPWVLQYAATERALWNAIVLGVIIAVAAIAALVKFREWEEWADIAFGVWLVISPWVLGFGTTMVAAEAGAFAATWNFVVVGLLTIGLAAWSLRHQRHRETQAT